jgi:hypothetical protein
MNSLPKTSPGPVGLLQLEIPTLLVLFGVPLAAHLLASLP